MLKNSFKNKYFNLILALIFILGFILRSYAYAVYRPLWRDECSLAINIYFGGFFDLWGVLSHMQSAPPIFMSICKLFNLINPNYPEYFLRLFPFICGILSIYLFFLITKRMFHSKLAIAAANLAFAINMQLIYYSHEFKQYSSDIMVVLGCVLYLSKIKLSSLTTKQVILNAILLAILPLLSLPSFFVIAGWIFLSVYGRSNIKRLILTIIPIFFVNILYYLFILRPSQKVMLENYGFMWRRGFLSFDFNLIYSIVHDNLAFYFQQCRSVVIPILLIITGLIFVIKRGLKIDKLIIIMLSIVIAASFLSIYPIQGRVSVYLLPFMILLLVMPIDSLKQNWAKVICIIMLLFVLFGKNNYGIIDLNCENPALMMKEMKLKYQKDDMVIYNDVSDSQYAIYSYIYNFKVPDSRLGTIQLADYGEEWYYGVLDILPKGRKYWFYYSYDIVTKPVVEFLKNWISKNGKILYELYPNKKSCLIYVQL